MGVPTLTGFQVPSGTSSTKTESPLEDNSMLCVCVCVRVSISVCVYIRILHVYVCVRAWCFKFHVKAFLPGHREYAA